MALEEMVLRWVVGMQLFVWFSFPYGVKVREFTYLNEQLNDTKVTKASSDPNRIVASMEEDRTSNKFMRDRTWPLGM